MSSLEKGIWSFLSALSLFGIILEAKFSPWVAIFGFLALSSFYFYIHRREDKELTQKLKKVLDKMNDN